MLFIALMGCSSDRPRYWPEEPQLEAQREDSTWLGFDVNDDGRLDCMQRLHDGFKDRLHYPPAEGRGPWTRVERGTAAAAKARPLLVLLLDGVSYDRMRRAYEAGRFRLFHAPARVVSTFPSVTDVAYGAFFGLGPAPGYEAAYYDRPANRLTPGVSTYLSGHNEPWVAYVDYRIGYIEDAFMYLRPQSTFVTELRNARKRLEERLGQGRTAVVLYLLSTDGLGHMVESERIDELLISLDEWIERIVFDQRGEIELLMLSDHGNTKTEPHWFDIAEVVRAAGLRMRKSLERPGDVVVPLFGLLDVARVHTFDAATRDRAVAALRGRDEVEVLAWRDGDEIVVELDGRRGRISSRMESEARVYRCLPEGDRADDWAPVLDRLRTANALDADGYAPAAAWLAATDDSRYPALVPRLWDGLNGLSDERPDVVASLRETSYIGSGFFAAVTKLRGTHGGLSDAASAAFVMSSRIEFTVTRLMSELSGTLRDNLGWPPPVVEPIVGTPEE